MPEPGELGQLEGRDERTQEYADHFNMTPAPQFGEPVRYAKTVLDFAELAKEAQRLRGALDMRNVEVVHYHLPNRDAEYLASVIEYFRACLGPDADKIQFHPQG